MMKPNFHVGLMVLVSVQLLMETLHLLLKTLYIMSQKICARHIAWKLFTKIPKDYLHCTNCFPKSECVKMAKSCPKMFLCIRTLTSTGNCTPAGEVNNGFTLCNVGHSLCLRNRKMIKSNFFFISLMLHSKP